METKTGSRIGRERMQAGLYLQVPARDVLANIWKRFKDYFLRKLKVPQEKEEEISTTFLSPISSLQEEEEEVLSSTPTFDWDWEEKVSVIAEDEEVNATDFESENINASDIDIANVSIKIDVSAEKTFIYTNSENGSSAKSEKMGTDTIEKDQTDENEEFLLRIDSIETSDNRSVGTNLTNNETEGIYLEEPVDAAEDSFMDDMEIETDGGGGEVKDLENIDKIHESMGSSFDAMFSPQRNRGKSLPCSLFNTFATFLLLLCPLLYV